MASRIEKMAEKLVDRDTHRMQQLIDIRNKWELTAEQVAERMGVSVRTVEEFEHYDSDPTLSMIRRYELAMYSTQ